MWIMLIKKLPTEVSPPKLSIFWSEPWPESGHTRKDVAKKKSRRVSQDFDEFDVWDVFGQEPDWNNARRIIYRGTPVRVFPHEFSVLTAERMRDYVGASLTDYDPSHFLVYDERVMHTIQQLDADGRMIYEAALVDGCSPRQAEMVALGIDLDDAAIEFPPIGWYKPDPRYGIYFCDVREMEEKHPQGDNSHMALLEGYEPEPLSLLQA